MGQGLKKEEKASLKYGMTVACLSQVHRLPMDSSSDDDGKVGLTCWWVHIMITD